MATILEVDYFNSFWTKRVHTGSPCIEDPDDAGGIPVPNMSQSTGTFLDQ